MTQGEARRRPAAGATAGGRPARGSRRGLGVGASIACLLVANGCWNGGLSVGGRVAIDGRPVDLGTISFRSVTGRSVSGGAGIKDGNFVLGSRGGLPAGKYQVTLMAFRKTGRMIDDPLRGPQPETTPLAVADNPQEVELAADNSASLQLEFHAANAR